MAYILNGETLPNPQGFGIDKARMEVRHEAINGRTTKEVRNIKNIWKLRFTKLTQEEASVMLGIANLKQTVLFESTETNKLIPETEVHVTIDREKYNTKGSEYRVDLDVVLEEVE